MAEHRQGLRAAVADGFPSTERASIGKELSLRLTGFFRRMLLALHESRRRQGERELRRYADLVDYAHAHPLALDDRNADADPEAGGRCLHVAEGVERRRRLGR